MNHKILLPDTPEAIEKINRLIIVLATVFAFLYLLLPLFFGQVYYSDDFRDYHLPLKYFYHRCLILGDSFLWCPNIFQGYYLHGEGQLGMLHPWHLFLYGALPFTWAFNLELAGSYGFGYAGMYLLLRHWQLPRSGSLFGAFVFAFSGFNLMHVMHMNGIAVISHVPWLIMVSSSFLKSESRRSWLWLAIAGLTTSQVLLGHPQMLYYSLLMEGFCLLAFATWKHQGKWMGCLILGKTLGITGGAMQLFPTLDVFIHSTRFNFGGPALEAGDFALTGSLHPINLLQFFSPYLLVDRQYGYNPQEFCIYGGAFMTMAYLVSISYRDRMTVPGRLIGGMMILGSIGLILAMGKYTGIQYILAKIPLLNSFRISARYILLFHFAGAVLSGVVISAMLNSATVSHAWRQSGRHRRWAGVGLAIMCIIVGIAGCWLARQDQWSEAISSNQLSIMGGSLIVGLVVLITMKAISHSRFTMILLGLIVIDIMIYSGSYIAKLQTIDYENQFPYAHMESTRTKPLYSRINEMINFDRKLLFGYVSLFPRRGMSREELAIHAQPPRLQLYKMDEVDELNALSTSITPISESKRGGEISMSGINDRVYMLWDRPGDIVIRAKTDQPLALLLKETYHPGWQVSINGQPTSTLKLMNEFLGCHVPSGNHEIRFVFKPASFSYGLYLSAFSVVLSLIIAYSMHKKKSLS